MTGTKRKTGKNTEGFVPFASLRPFRRVLDSAAPSGYGKNQWEKELAMGACLRDGV
jgi:hypothetical protein